MKNKALKIINLIVAALVCAFAIGYAFAWFPESRRTDDVDFNGSSGQTYFAGGSGTADEPFIINDKYHLYNLAWLQNTGKLTTKYYFELDGNLSIPENFWLPPIGTDEYEFIGDFNGNGNTISGLQITTDKSKLSKVGLPSGSSAFSNAVGMFGMTGSGSEIHNFVLDTPIVEVATANATYSQSSDRTVGIAIGMVSGKAYSIGVLADEGGDGAQLLLNRAGYSTFNSIIGALKANTTSSVTGGGYLGSGGSGNAFGASFDVEGMYDRLIKIEANKNSDTPSWRLPNLGDSSSTSITLGSLEKLPFTVSSLSVYTGDEAAEVVENNNIGYLLGNQNKVYSKSLAFGDLLYEAADGSWTYSDGTTPASGTFPRWIYKTSAPEIASDVYNSGNGFVPLTQIEFDSLSEGIKDLIPETSGKVNMTSVRLSQTYQNASIQIYAGSDANGQWSPHGQISWMGKTYGEGFRYSDGYAVDINGNYIDSSGGLFDENGYVYSPTDGYYVNSLYWALYDENGNQITLSTYNVDDEGYVYSSSDGYYYDGGGNKVKEKGYTITYTDGKYYLTKPDGSFIDTPYGYMTPKLGSKIALNNYTSGIALPNCGIWFKPSQTGTIRFVMYAETAGDGFALVKGKRTSATKENPFIVDYSKWGTDVEATEVGKFRLPSNVLFYFEFEVSEEDIEDGRVEYWLMQYGDGGAYFVYMDLGASAAEDNDASLLDPDTDVSAIDFIYSGVTISTNEETTGIAVGNFIIGTSGSYSAYEATKTSVYFENLNTILQIVFVRPENGKNSNGVTLIVTVSASEGLDEIKQTKTTASIAT